MNRIGTDIKFVEGVTWYGDGPAALDAAAKAGLDGVNVRTLDELAPTLDPGVLREFSSKADELGLYVTMGVGKVNPYMTAELPRVRDLGGGSYLAGMVRLIEVSAAHGWTELWTAVGGFKMLPGIFFTDRFRTDADWEDQLVATERFLLRLAPALRANGVRLNLETHEEITSYELVRLIEAVGDDVLGVCLDPANLLVRAEVPNEAVLRLAPYVHTTHLRDAVLVRSDAGLSRFLAPCGLGVIDWAPLLGAILAHDPDMPLTIEGIGAVRAEMPLHTSDPRWLAGHPDLSDIGLAALYALADEYERRLPLGRVEPLSELRAVREDGLAAHDRFVALSADHLRRTLAHADLTPPLSRG